MLIPSYYKKKKIFLRKKKWNFNFYAINNWRGKCLKKVCYILKILTNRLKNWVYGAYKNGKSQVKTLSKLP